MANAVDQTTKHYLKGQKMKIDSGGRATVIDFVEMHMWPSRDVPGAHALRAFHEKNRGRFGRLPVVR